MRQLERGETGALEPIDTFPSEEHATREPRRIGVVLRTARLMPPKTLESFDFTFRPSLDRGRIMALAQLDFVARAEVVRCPGPPGTGRSHLAAAFGVAAVKAGQGAYRATLAEASAAASARDAGTRKSAYSVAAACSASTRSATCQSRPAAPISSSSASLPDTRKAR